jgi:ATP-dependent Zn protease
LKILDKYKNTCNSNNKKLIFIKSECDKSFGNKYTHGGYQCGENKKWKEECVASYCDIGYIFDHNKQKCIIDVCSEREKDENENEQNKETETNNEGNNSKVYYILIPCLIIFIIVIIVIVIFVMRKNRKTNLEIENIDKDNLVGN